MFDFMKDIIFTVLRYLKADWSILLIGITIAVAIKVYVSDQSFKNYLDKNSKVSILGSIGFGAFTPLCACGTMAVLLSMFITAMPWGPVMAFLVSSPLTSPSQFMFQTSFFGTNFAIAVLISSIVLGLAAGIIAQILDKKTGFFHGQFKLSKKENEKSSETSSCCGTVDINTNFSAESSSCCTPKASFVDRFRIKKFLTEFYNLGIKKVLFYFVIFIAIGRVVEMIIPKEWIMALFVDSNSYSIPLAASIGLPIYVSGSAALPLMKSFMNMGASEGALLAFLVTGKATGLPVIAGMSTILKKRAILFYVLFVYFGGIVAGTLYQIFINMGL